MATISALGAELRHAMEAAPIPDDLASAVVESLARLGADAAYPGRSVFRS